MSHAPSLSSLRLMLLVGAVALSSSACCLCDTWFRNFERYECRSKQSEAKSNLRAIYTAQQAFHAESDRFGTLEEVGWTPGGEALRYDYELLESTDTAFVAEARGRDEMAGDRWVIDQSGQLDVVESLCGPVPDSRPAPAGDGSGETIEVAY